MRAIVVMCASVTIAATAGPGAMAAVAIFSGDGQTVVSGSATQPLVVRATDQFGNAVANATITWTATGGGTLSATSSMTDASGFAQVILTTGVNAGSYTVTATGTGGTPVTFTVTST